MFDSAAAPFTVPCFILLAGTNWRTRGEVQVLCHRRTAAAGAIADGDRDGIAEPPALQCGGSGTDAAAAWRVKGGCLALRVREGNLIDIASPETLGVNW